MSRPRTTLEAAAELNCSVDSVLDLIRCGRLKAWRLGRQYRIEAEDIAAFKKAQQHVVPPRVVPLSLRPKRPTRRNAVEDLPEAQYFT
jgi:excisionase family DNA binding protein